MILSNSLSSLATGTAMDKKQKKQIEVAKKKILNLQTLLTAAKSQPDDPQEIPKLESEIAKQKKIIADIQAEG